MTPFSFDISAPSQHTLSQWEERISGHGATQLSHLRPKVPCYPPTLDAWASFQILVYIIMKTNSCSQLSPVCHPPLMEVTLQWPLQICGKRRKGRVANRLMCVRHPKGSRAARQRPLPLPEASYSTAQHRDCLCPNRWTHDSSSFATSLFN